MSKNDRARQFLPFNALKGYYDEIRKKEFVKTEKRELSEDYLIELSNTINAIEKNMIVKITYYDIDSYKTICGVVSKIDKIYNYIIIVKTKIGFDNISEILVD